MTTNHVTTEQCYRVLRLVLDAETTKILGTVNIAAEQTVGTITKMGMG